MPLSKAAPRRHIHTREIRCLGFEREDGLWDIEGTMTDTKTYTVDNQDRNGIAAGEPIHAMRIRVTIDADMLIHDIPQLIAYISTFAPLEPGDVIVTGTPGGVGNARTPPEYMFPGDTVEVEITGVGLLRNPIKED